MVKISLHTFERIQHLDTCRLPYFANCKIENQSVSGFDLYGFFEEIGKRFIRKTISVSGVGCGYCPV